MLLIGTAMLAGCARTATADEGEPPIGEVLPIADPGGLSLPLDGYQPSPAARRTINEASAVLLVRCMRRFGFEVPRPRPTGPPPSANGSRYGLVDEEQARRHGYHPPPKAGAGRPGGPPSEPELSPAAEAVAEGTGQRVPGLPAGGCLGEARRKLAEGGPTPADPSLVDRLSLESYTRSEQDSRTRRVFGAWSGCMRRAGYDYVDPMKANDDPAFRTARPSAREIAIATADVRCKRETNVVGTWATVETAYQQRAIDRHAEQLQAAKALLEAEVRTATRIVAGA